MTAALRAPLSADTAAARRGAATLLRALAPLALGAAVLLGALFVFKGAFALLADATRIEVVRVEGSFGELTRGEIEQSLAQLVAGHSLVDVPMRRIATELSGLSWVAGVHVYRVWPHGLIVRVTEKVPVARWNGEGFISHAGEVFQPENAAGVGNLPLLRGPADKATQVMAFYQQANSMLIPLGMGIRELTLNAQLSWEIVTGSGIRIRVDQEEGASRLRRFLRVYDKRLAAVGDRIASIDLRYIGGFAVHWTPGATAPKQASTGAAAPGGEYGQGNR